MNNYVPGIIHIFGPLGYDENNELYLDKRKIKNFKKVVIKV